MDATINENVKQEVLNAYNDVMRKLQEPTSAFADDIRHENQLIQERMQMIEPVLQETPDFLVKNMTDLKQLIGRTLDDLKQRLLPEYEKFFTVRKAIALSETELKELYQVKVSAGTLTALVQAHKEKMLAYEAEIADCKKIYAQEKLQMAKDLEKEHADYIIKRDAARKADQEKYENSKREVEKALAQKRAAFEEEFESREARIAAREKEHQQLKERETWILARDQEYHELKERTAYHAEELRLAVQKVERAAIEKLTSKYEYEAKLIHIEIDSERKLYQQRIATLEEQIEQYKSLKHLFANQPSLAEDAPSFVETPVLTGFSNPPLFSELEPSIEPEVPNDVPPVVEAMSEREKNEKILRDFLLTEK